MLAELLFEVWQCQLFVFALAFALVLDSNKGCPPFGVLLACLLFVVNMKVKMPGLDHFGHSLSGDVVDVSTFHVPPWVFLSQL